MREDDEVNALPGRLLSAHGVRSFSVRASAMRPQLVVGGPGLGADSLRPVPEAAALGQTAVDLGLCNLTLCAFRIDPALVEEATTAFGNRELIAGELLAFAARHPEASLVHVLAHANEGPLGELTTFIGGDSHRAASGSLSRTIARTRDLSRVMLRKAVMVFPGVPAVHGGRHGQWMLVGPGGERIDDLSDPATVALGTVAISTAIEFSNRCREDSLRSQSGEGFPRARFILPDTGSPDVLSGPFWQRMCGAWQRRGIDLGRFTCVPPQFHGPPSPPARPTGYGIATTAVLLAQSSFHEEPEKLASRRFLVEALGGVSHYAIEALIGLYRIPPSQILAIDPRTTACNDAEARFGIRTHRGLNTEAYAGLPPSERADVWINNGLGGDVGETDVRRLVGRGVRVFCGAANNFLRPAELERSLAAIFEAGGTAWPDEAASGGGYAMAVLDAWLRGQRLKANTGQADHLFVHTIVERNRALLVEALACSAAPGAGSRGEALWKAATAIVNARVERALGPPLPLAEARAAADITRWELPRLAG